MAFGLILARSVVAPQNGATRLGSLAFGGEKSPHAGYTNGRNATETQYTPAEAERTIDLMPLNSKDTQEFIK